MSYKETEKLYRIGLTNHTISCHWLLIPSGTGTHTQYQGHEQKHFQETGMKLVQD